MSLGELKLHRALPHNHRNIHRAVQVIAANVKATSALESLDLSGPGHTRQHAIGHILSSKNRTTVQQGTATGAQGTASTIGWAADGSS